MEFLASDGDNRLVESLGTHGLALARSDSVERCYLETFDGRLFDAGLTIEIDAGDANNTTLRLRDAQTGATARTIENARTPTFAADFESGPIRDLIEPIIEMRALMAVANAHVRRTELAERDSEGKIVCRLEIERTPNLGVAVRIVDVRGFATASERMRRRLIAEPNVIETADTLAARAMADAGFDPNGYASKPVIELDPEEFADSAFRRLMGAMLETVEANERGTIDNIDSEFLHDYRVAVRRARSLVSLGHDVLPRRLRAIVRDELRWLGTATTPARDLDVHLLSFDEYRASVADSARDGLEELRTYLDARRNDAYRQLGQQLRSPEYLNALGDWRALIDNRWDEPGPDADRPIGEVAAKLIGQAYRRVRNDGRAITSHSADAALHDLRKSAKRLRYAIESFRGMYDHSDMADLIGGLKELQDVLGRFQDAVVHAEEIRDIGRDMEKEGEASVAALMAMGAVADSIERSKRRARDEFGPVFAAFDSKPIRKIYKRYQLFR